MKRTVLLGFCLLALAAPAFAINGVGDLGAYADDQGSSCSISAPGNPAPFNIYLVHKFLPGEASSADRFKVVLPAGMTFFAFSTPNTTSGGVLVDISVGYAPCLVADTMIGSLLVQAVAPIANCSYVSVQTADTQTDPIALDCGFIQHVMKAGQAIVNDASCPCTVASEPTSWGKVKALYR